MSDKTKEMELANPPNGETNVKEDAEMAAAKVPTGEDGEEVPLSAMVKDKVISSLNVRINEFSNPLTLAISIGFFMLCGFIALVCINALVCPINTTITRTVDFNTGNEYMHKAKIDSIKNPPNADELEAAGITRTVEICLNSGGIMKYESVTDTTNNVQVPAVIVEACILGSNQDMADGDFDVKWCDGKSDDSTATTKCTLNSENVFGVEFVSTVTEVQEACPTFSAALGAALAYISYLELFFTAVVGYVLVKCGVCKPLNEKATIGGLLSSADNATQEIEDAIEKLRADVDKLMDSPMMDSPKTL